MGLDMFAYKTKDGLVQAVDFKVENCHEIHYWRKHPNLHGWMEELYYRKGGAARFNCVPVTLDAAELDELEQVLRAGKLPETEGFFFGASTGEELEDDLTFIEKARQAIAEGYTVFYDSWW